MQQHPVPGRSLATRRAIVDVVLAAVQSSYGVTGLADRNLGARILRWLGLRRAGITFGRHEPLGIDLYLTVAYGVPVAEVARQVDSAVRYAVRRAFSREVDRLTIHVDGLRYQPPAVPAPDSTQTPAPAPVASAEAADEGSVDEPA